LNPQQTVKFTNDYVKFLNQSLKPGANIQQLLTNAGTSFRTYLNDGQFTKLTQMIQAGKLDPVNAGVKTSASTQVTTSNGQAQSQSQSQSTLH